MLYSDAPLELYSTAKVDAAMGVNGYIDSPGVHTRVHLPYQQKTIVAFLRVIEVLWKSHTVKQRWKPV